MSKWDHISPGVRQLVESLNDRGYITTDSGDGSNHAKGMEGAIPVRHVFGLVNAERGLIDFANELQMEYPGAHVEVNYSPPGPAVFAVFPDGVDGPEGEDPPWPVPALAVCSADEV